VDDRNAVQRFFQPNMPRSPRSPSGGIPKTPDGNGTSQADISDFLHGSSSIEVHRGLGASPSSKSAKLTREPDSIESTGQSPKDLEEARPVTPVGRLSGVGLRSSIDIPASPETGRPRSGSTVTEQVARLSSPKSDKHTTGS
jgi:hypothetical protein